MISACCSTPTNCGSSRQTVGTAMTTRAMRSRQPAPNRMPQPVHQPPRHDEQNGHHTAGEVNREHAEQCEHRQRDAVAVAQRRNHQHHRRYGDAVGGEVGHRSGVELDIGNGGERRRQRGGGRGRPGGAPLVGPVPQQPPGQGRRAHREQPDRRRERAEGVGGGRCRPGQRTEHRGECVKCRGVVKGVMGLDVAQLAHVCRRRLPGVENESDRIGVPDGVPCAGYRLPVRQPLHRRQRDQCRAEQHAGGHDERGTAGHRPRLRVGVAEAARAPSANRLRPRSRWPEQQKRSTDSTECRSRRTARWPVPQRRRSVRARRLPLSAKTIGPRVPLSLRVSPATTAPVALRGPSSLD